MKRTGLLLLVLVALIIGIDGILSLVRQRNIYVAIHATGIITPAPLQPTQAAVPGDATLQATSAVANGDLQIAPQGTITVEVSWDYRVGPVFPKTTVNAAVYDSTGHVISEQQHVIDCNSASLQCDGSLHFLLTYGMTAQPSDTITAIVMPWPPDSYVLQVTRAYEGFAPLKIAAQSFRVIQ